MAFHVFLVFYFVILIFMFTFANKNKNRAMNTLRTIGLLLLACTIGTATYAQETKKERTHKTAPYMLVGLQGGATRTFTNPALDRHWAPMGALSFGAYFTPWLGARLQGNGWMWNEDLLDKSSTYKTKEYGGHFDLLLNLTGFFFPNRNNLINVVALGGYGVQYDKFDIAETSHPYPLSLKGDRWTHNWRAGGQIDLSLSRQIGIQLEGGYMLHHDCINEFKVEKWWPYLMAGVSFKFGHPKNRSFNMMSTQLVADAMEDQNAGMGTAQPMVQEEKPVVEEKKPEPKPEVKPEPKPEAPKPVVKAPEKSSRNVFFTLGSAVVTIEQTAAIDQIADWAKQHPEASILLTG